MNWLFGCLNRQWFRITQGMEMLEGTRLKNGYLHLVVKFADESISIKCSPQNIEKLRDWLCDQYPRGRKDGSNIYKLPGAFPIRKDAADSGGSSGDPK